MGHFAFLLNNQNSSVDKWVTADSLRCCISRGMIDSEPCSTNFFFEITKFKDLGFRRYFVACLNINVVSFKWLVLPKSSRSENVWILDQKINLFCASRLKWRNNQSVLPHYLTANTRWYLHHALDVGRIDRFIWISRFVDESRTIPTSALISIRWVLFHSHIAFRELIHLWHRD
jgi:hypothetical protein